MFEKINLKDWKRKPYFDLYFNQMKCTYSITVNMDITRLMTYKQRNNTKLYPLLIYAIVAPVKKIRKRAVCPN